ncbi:MAG: ribonuclease III [Rickettsiales bacterium]|nr:ribonuclease III [Rickettsiales bacterium]
MHAADRIAEATGYRFRNNDLLKQALTHPSDHLAPAHYERLEFLGDAVLGLAVSELLYTRYPEEREGALAKRRAALVCGNSLAVVARSIGLGELLSMGEGEIQSGGRDNDTNLENAMEALFGAIYLDGGWEHAHSLAQQLFAPYAESMLAPPKDPKTRLQEWIQAQGHAVPHYRVLAKEGPAHAPFFTMEVSIAGGHRASGTGTSKREAEREAASALLTQLGIEDDHDQ